MVGTGCCLLKDKRKSIVVLKRNLVYSALQSSPVSTKKRTSNKGKKKQNKRTPDLIASAHISNIVFPIAKNRLKNKKGVKHFQGRYKWTDDIHLHFSSMFMPFHLTLMCLE